ncbi:MAG: XF1762 family protein [Candidatus Nanohaloarchaea archaeon]
MTEYTEAEGHLEIIPIKFSEAEEFIAKYHSHNDPPQGWKFGCAVANTAINQIVGVTTVGRPVSRHYDDGKTLEITRNCIRNDIPKKYTKNASSKLYAAAWRATKNLGYEKLITYTIKEKEKGTPLKATGFNVLEEKCGGGDWDSQSRPRDYQGPKSAKTSWIKRNEKEKIQIEEAKERDALK